MQYLDTFNKSYCIWDYIQKGSIWINHTLANMFWPKTHEIRVIRVIKIVLYLNRVLHETNFNFRGKRRCVCWTSLLYVNMSLICVCLKRVCNEVSEFWQCLKIPMSTLSIVNLFVVLFFGENPQAVAYSAQPLCWSGWENPLPHHSQGSSTERWSRNTPRLVTARVPMGEEFCHLNSHSIKVKHFL